KRVVWPTRKEVLNSSVVVIVTLIFFTALLFVIDSVAVQIIDLISRIG
ncbi:MAG: preprotein translocase subunit SecE, partial [Actinobacteria bacterium]